ncbi:hypothetical protein [Nitrincola sp. MINF-07-Sa-05]|uniref:c-type cytochrome n=1 Tax=Nitrincola salilacus TaxID=3400273 RepID=UPI00391838DB
MKKGFKIIATLVALVAVVVAYNVYEFSIAGRDTTGVPLDAPAGSAQVQPVPDDWAVERTRRHEAKQTYIAQKQEAFDWFTRFPFSESDGTPLIMLRLLPVIAPELWGEGDEFLSVVGLFHDTRAEQRFLPSGVGFSGLSRQDPKGSIDYTSFTCAACHIGRVRVADNSLQYIDGGINAEFNINHYFVLLHQTLAAIYGDETDPSARQQRVTEAFLSALDRAESESETFFYRDYRYNPSYNGNDYERHFDAEYEAAQIALFRQNADQYVADFVNYTEGFVAAFSDYLDKTYDGFQAQMLGGFPGMADATGVSSSHGYELLEATATGRLVSHKFLPDSPGLTDFMAVWEQSTRTAEWDSTQQQLINGGGQYNGNIPIPIFRNLAASMTMGLQNTDLRVAAFSADLLDQLPATPYPFDVDETLAGQGQTLFARHCAECHQPNNGRVYNELGTSPARSEVINTWLMEGAREEYKGICSPDTSIVMYGQEVKPCAEFKGVSLKDMDHVIMRPLDDQRGYNATSLRGVWALAPYLHNGSVPTVYHLLMPQTRPDQFVKSRLDYDQQHLGFVWDGDVDVDGEGYLFDIRQFHALSNKGHDADVILDGTTYKLDWSDDPSGALAIIEYLKTL